MKNTVCIALLGMLLGLSAGCNKADKTDKTAQTVVKEHDHGATCDHGHEAEASITNKWEPETAASPHEHNEHDGHDHSGHNH